MHRVVVEQIAGLEVVGAVEQQVRAGQQLVDIGWNQVSDGGVDRDLGVDGGDLAAGGLGLGQRGQGVGFIEQDLALQVRGLDEVAVDQREMADAGARQQRGRSRSRGAAAHHRDMAGGQ